MDNHVLPAFEDEVPRPHLHLEDGILAAGHRHKPIIVDHLDVAAPLQGHEAGPWRHDRRRVIGAPVLLREHAADAVVQLVRHSRDDAVGDDRAGDLVHVEQQRKQAHHGERAGDRHGGMGHALRAEGPVEAAQHHQHVQDGAEKQPEHDLDLAVAHEGRDQPRPELVGRHSSG